MGYQKKHFVFKTFLWITCNKKLLFIIVFVMYPPDINIYAVGGVTASFLHPLTHFPIDFPHPLLHSFFSAPFSFGHSFLQARRAVKHSLKHGLSIILLRSSLRQFLCSSSALTTATITTATRRRQMNCRERKKPWWSRWKVYWLRWSEKEGKFSSKTLWRVLCRSIDEYQLRIIVISTPK